MSGQAGSLGDAQQRDAGPVQPGDVIDGKYRVDRVLGAGGMGVVVAATHLQLGSAVAIKLVRAEAVRNPEVVARFQREARIAATLRSDHVVRVTDIGTLPGQPVGVPYMVLELLDGTDLSDAIDKRKALPVDEAVAYLVEACEAVGEAHAQGIIHRDLKPANLFLAKRPKGRPIVKVLDFGISSMAAGDEDARLTATGSVMGTPLYMAPEQMIDARKADARSDVWALGAILYEMLAGAPPFPGNTFGAVHAKVITTEAPPLRPRRPDVPAELEAVVLRCLQKPPEQRYPSVAALEEALRPFMGLAVSNPSLPAIDSSALPPQHTTHVLPGGKAPAHTTLLLGQDAPPSQPRFGAPPLSQPGVGASLPTATTSGGTSWDAKTTLRIPEPRRRRTAVGVAIAAAVLGCAVLILVIAFVRGALRSERAVAAPAPAPSVETSEPVVMSASAAPPPKAEPPAPSAAASASAATSAPPAKTAVAKAPSRPASTKPAPPARPVHTASKPPAPKRAAPGLVNER